MIEVWKSLDRFDGYYDASSLGRVRRAKPGSSLSGNGTWVGRLSKPRNKKGYLEVELSVRGRRYFVLIHILVAEAFIGPKPLGKEVNHKNGDKQDNRAKNLEYLDAYDNVHHAIKLGLKKGGYLRWKEVEQIRKNYKHNKRGNGCYVLADKFGVTPKTIWNIVNERCWVRK